MKKMKKESISVKVIATKHQPKERILMMTTLTQNTLHFNRSIKLSNDRGALSSDTDELIYREFVSLNHDKSFERTRSEAD
ncbi:hypothetical protein ACFDTO_21225 [Microbacteriaceae bacterium 4G12]